MIDSTVIRMLAVGMVVGVLAMGGCRRINTVERDQPLATPDYVDARVSSPDLTLSRAVRLVNVREGYAGELLQIEVEVRNKTSRTKHFKYRFDWVDDRGMTVRSPLSGWTSKTILAKEHLSLTAIAPSPQAVDFRLKLYEND